MYSQLWNKFIFYLLEIRTPPFDRVCYTCIVHDRMLIRKSRVFFIATSSGAGHVGSGAAFFLSKDKICEDQRKKYEAHKLVFNT